MQIVVVPVDVYEPQAIPQPYPSKISNDETDIRVTRLHEENEILGELSIKDLDPEYVKKYDIKIGQVTPFTRLRVIS